MNNDELVRGKSGSVEMRDCFFCANTGWLYEAWAMQWWACWHCDGWCESENE